MIVANMVKEMTSVKEVWFIVSPQNPFKESEDLLHELDRLDLVKASICGNAHFRVSDVEFKMPKPNYTVDTMVYLKATHPDKQFKLIVGEDNLASFEKWKDYAHILSQFGLIVYPRIGASPSELIKNEHVTFIRAPMTNISATLIRKLVREGKSIKYLVPQVVEERINRRKYFEFEIET